MLKNTALFSSSRFSILPLLALPLLLSGCVAASADRGAAAPVTPPAQNIDPRPAVKPDNSRPQIQPTSPQPALPATPVEGAATALAAGVQAGPDFASLGISAAQASQALAAFRISCPSVQKRSDASELTQPQDWTAPCAAAENWPDAQASAFFVEHFKTVQVGSGAAFATGYFEPEIAASRTKSAGYSVPIYRRPADLVEVKLGDFSDDLAGRTIRGRVDQGKFVRYYDRKAITEGALAGRGLEIAYAADAAEFFFLQIQGSGRLRLPDGRVMRIGYDTQNGRGYVGIGKLLLDRGELARGKADMQGIIDYLRADPVRGAAVMNENPSWIFFRELTGAGPLGALGLPVSGKVTVAADPKFIPLGAPVFLSMDRGEANGLWVAQDTGGAIKGANRVDTFWGAGDEARRIAGGMAARGSALLLLPHASAARLTMAR
jgi:membrane-bound lytic murein transglycosylase A